MFDKFLNLFGGGSVKDLVLGVFDRIKGMSPEDRAKIQSLVEEHTFELSKIDAELKKQAMTVEETLIKESAATVRVDQGSADWFVRRARPYFLWIMGTSVGFSCLVYPLINAATGKGLVYPEIPATLIGLFATGFTGYGVMRSYEKKNGVA